MEWRIYYADGTTFSDQDGAWDDGPLDGVICVVVADPDYGRYVLNGLNYFYSQVRGGPQDKAHTNDIGPQLRKQCRWLKHGVAVARKEFMDILIRATKDPDFDRPRHPMRRSEDGKT